MPVELKPAAREKKSFFGFDTVCAPKSDGLKGNTRIAPPEIELNAEVW